MAKVIFLFYLHLFLFHLFSHHFLDSQNFVDSESLPLDFFNQLCDCFFIFYLSNKWGVDQLSLWLTPYEINPLARHLKTVFKHLCDLRVGGSFHIWLSSAIISVIWEQLIPSMASGLLTWVIISVTCLWCRMIRICYLICFLQSVTISFSNLNMKPYSRLNLKKGVVGSSLIWQHSCPASYEFSIYVFLGISGF